MKVLALGATGAIGDSLVSLLAREAHDVYITSRSARAPQVHLNYLVGDAQKDEFLSPLLEQRWDAIIDFMVYNTNRFSNRVNRLLNATDQYIFLSTGRVFASSEAPLRENSSRLLDVCGDANYLATDEYALTKARQEDLLRASGMTNWTIVRPYITFGSSRLQLGPLEKEDWLYRANKGRTIVFCDALLDRETTLTDCIDVAGMIAALIGRLEALGEDFNLTNGISVGWDSVLSTYQSVLKQQRGQDTPVLLQDFETFCKSTNPAQVRYDRLYHRRFDTEKISAVYDVSRARDPLSSLAKHVEKALSGFVSYGPLNWRAEALRDRATGEHVRVAEFPRMARAMRYLTYRHLPIDLIKRAKGR